MANIRIDDAPGGALATLLAADFFLVQKQSNDVDYHVTPEVIKDYMETGLTMTGTLACGAQSVTGTACAFTGGTLLGMTSIVTGLLDVDNIRINGNTISSIAGTDLLITPLAGQQLVLDGKVIIDDGDITGVETINVSGISTLSEIDSGAVTIDKSLAFDGTAQSTSGADTINSTTIVTKITTGAGAAALSISDGTYEGQMKYIYMVADGGGDATLTLGGGSTIVLAGVNEGATLIWDEVNENWRCVGCSGTFTA